METVNLATASQQDSDGSPRGDGRTAHAGWRHVVPLLVTFAAAAYLIPFVDQGWIPHDEGLLGQSAERVLRGELPHRDFDDTYTGGQSLLHALAFAILGVKLESLRWLLWAGTLAFVPACYSLAARVAAPWLAALVTAACLLWSVPNYFAAMPTWYVLYLTTFGLVFLLRYLDTGRRRWLFAAGICAGVALLMKIVALYAVAAALMFLAFHESQRGADKNAVKPRSFAFPVFLALIGVALCGLVTVLLRRGSGGSLEFTALFHFLIPCLAVCATPVLCELRSGRGAFVERVRHLTWNVMSLCGGVLLPVGVFLIAYAAQGELGRLYTGVIVLPQLRFEYTHIGLPPAITLLLLVIPLLVFGAGLVPPERPRLRMVAQVGITVVVGLLLVFAGARYYEIWYSLRNFLPVAAVAACLLLVRASSARVAPDVKQAIYLMTATAVLFSLVQYPAGHPIYFCYCVPLVLLVMHYTVAAVPRWRYGYAALLVLYTVFGVSHLNRGYWTLPADRVAPNEYRLDLRRSRLRVSENQQRNYQAIMALIDQHAAGSAAILATPDCPEIYFLSERQNPTRVMYDFFDTQSDRTHALIGLLDDANVQLAVINTAPVFSPPIDARLDAAIRKRFPNRRQVGDFIIAWEQDEPLERPTATRRSDVPGQPGG